MPRRFASTVGSLNTFLIGDRADWQSRSRTRCPRMGRRVYGSALPSSKAWPIEVRTRGDQAWRQPVRLQTISATSSRIERGGCTPTEAGQTKTGSVRKRLVDWSKQGEVCIATQDLCDQAIRFLEVGDIAADDRSKGIFLTAQQRRTAIQAKSALGAPKRAFRASCGNAVSTASTIDCFTQPSIGSLPKWTGECPGYFQTIVHR